MRRYLTSFLTAVLLFGLFSGCKAGESANGRTLEIPDASLTGAEAQLSALRYALLSEGPSDAAILDAMAEEKIAVFLSASDGTETAQVLCGTGDTAEAAFDAAAEKLRQQEDFDAFIWLKADLVTASEKMTQNALERAIGKAAAYGYRRGVSLDGEFSCAFLEAEMNSRGLIDYEEDVLLEDAVLAAAAQKGCSMETLPEEFTVFDAMGWFCDDSGVYPLSTEDSSNYGRRSVDIQDPEVLTDIIAQASTYLLSMVKENGRFDYGYYPITHSLARGYNTIRHAGTVWNMALQYEITGSEALREGASHAMARLIEEFVVWEDEDTAYLLQHTKDEIQLGGNALGTLAITRYASAFGDHQYDEVAEDLARGILTMWDEEEGFIHSLNYPEMTVKEKFLIIYYDGEAAFALTELYGLTGKDEWLDASRMLLDYFVENNYEEYGDHWISYAVNEMTKLEMREEDILLGLRNIEGRLDRITKAKITWHTGAEMLMAGWELYLRAEESGLCRREVRAFDEEKLAESICYRMDYMLSGFMWPEYAMYFAKPAEVVGSFFVREDAFRIRIDDIQHNLGAYCLFYDNLESVTETAK